jgi:hypothetical protein
MMVLARVKRKFVESRLRLRILRAGQIERRLRRLILRFRVVQGLLRSSWRWKEIARAFDVRLRQFEVRFALPNRRLADFEGRLSLLDLLENLLILDARNALGAADAVRRASR